MYAYEYFVGGRSVGWKSGPCPGWPEDARQDSDSGNPIREALRAVCGAEPPSYVVGHSLHGLTDEENGLLQDWAGSHARPDWATGLSMLDAAELIVRQAVENANIECQCAGTGFMLEESDDPGVAKRRPCEVCRTPVPP